MRVRRFAYERDAVQTRCHVERSETSLSIAVGNRSMNDQRFFSRDCGIRMTFVKWVAEAAVPC